MRKVFNAINDNASELIAETSGCILPWVRSIRKAGELVEQEIDIATKTRKLELFPEE